MPIPPDYEERVYAGVLGKLIGVYLGRPFEGWSYERIMAELGEITYYVHERHNLPLIVTDDDISGTFTFLRALPDYGNSLELTSAQIGQTWLNYILEERTILWWGGLGNSTEHTAYLRLKNGIEAPRSGSRALNGKDVSEQIGAQIFIDGWAMVAPGDPAFAADLARRAASVSHDGEAVYGAQVIAAMEAQAFVETDIDKLIDTGVSLIPKDSLIYRMIEDVRGWHAGEADWRKTRERIDEAYGYHKFGGTCHMVPNHALVMLGLLYGEGDFQKSLMIVNTSGWDTDCNSGNVGCLLGIKNGLAGLEAGPDWRGPVADRLYLPTADSGRAITDAVTEAYHVVNIGRALAGQAPVAPKEGARFHFELPGSVQGFQVEDSAESKGTTTLDNVEGHSLAGRRTLALRYKGVAPGRVARASTPTFIPSVETARYFDTRGYSLLASPTLYPGQIVQARLVADEANEKAIDCGLYVRIFKGVDDQLVRMQGPRTRLAPGRDHLFSWQLEATGGAPLADIGVELRDEHGASGAVYLDYLTWKGEPNVTLSMPEDGGTMWRKAWVRAVDHFTDRWSDPYRLIHNSGRGLLIQGAREWRNYQASSTIYLHMVKAAGIAVRVQGMRRYYALLLCQGGKARLVKVLENEQTLAEIDYPWQYSDTRHFELCVVGNRLEASLEGQRLFHLEDKSEVLEGGAVAFVCEEGTMTSRAFTVQPA